jgi:hypothetical protein
LDTHDPPVQVSPQGLQMRQVPPPWPHESTAVPDGSHVVPFQQPPQHMPLRQVPRLLAVTQQLPPLLSDHCVSLSDGLQ